MNRFAMIRSSLILVQIVPLFAGDAIHSVHPPAATDNGWDFSISAGPAWRQIGDVRIHGGYRSAGLALPSLIGGDSFLMPPIGDPDTIGDRVYDDGFVRQDAGTPVDGGTWNWGYDSPGQVQGDQLVYHATGHQSIFSEIRSAPATGPSRTRDLEGIGPHLQFDALSPHRLGPFRVGFSASLDFVKTDRSFAFSSFSQNQTRRDFRLDYEDRYDLDGVIPPQAPYSGGFGGPGPIISNLPASRDVIAVPIGSDDASFSNAVSSDLDLNALGITLGPTLNFNRGSFDFAVSTGLALNVYDWEASQDEVLTATSAGGTTTFASWSDRDHGVTFRPGVYLHGEAAYRLTEDLGIAGFARLDIAKSFDIGVGPTKYEIDPCGVTAGLMLRLTLP